MNEIAELCVQNIMEHLRKKERIFFGPLKGRYPGAFCRLAMRDRAYFVLYIVEPDLERVFVDVFPQCICERPYLRMMHAYVNAKTSGYKSGRVDVDDENGEVRIRTETSIVDHAVTAGDIDDMEKLAIHVSDCLERRLDKIAHGVYFSEDDPDVMSAAERRLSQRKKGKDDDDDDDMLDSADDGDSDSLSDILKRLAAAQSIASDDSDGDSDSGIDSDPVTVAEHDPDEAAEEVEDTEERFDVVLVSCMGSKLQTIRVIRELTNASFADAKSLAEDTPSVILSGASRSVAEAAVAKLEAGGAKAEVH